MVKSLFVFVMFSIACASAQDRSYGRSMVVTPYGIVATSYVQASQAGARILEQGGSAIDAGIAANAVLGVAEPMMNGIGGDLFAEECEDRRCDRGQAAGHGRQGVEANFRGRIHARPECAEGRADPFVVLTRQRQGARGCHRLTQELTVPAFLQ